MRILATDDPLKPTQLGTGSGFGVGIVGEETAVFVTNRHVVWDSDAGKLSKHIYIMVGDNAVKKVYTRFGEFYDDERDEYCNVVVNPDRLVECEVLYPTGNDPEYPDLAIIRAARKIEGRVALPLKSAEEVKDTSGVWTIGYPASADKIYNTSESGKEVFYSADTESAELFSGTISRRGKMRNFGNTLSLTHSAQIDHGNSGGPLVDERGNVVGINTYGYQSNTTSVGYYCSIYIDYAMQELEGLGIPYNVDPKKASKSDYAAVEGGDSSLTTNKDSQGSRKAKPGKSIASLKVSEEDYDEDGKLESTHKRKYNKYGEWTESAKYDKNGKLVHRTEFKLDDCGERIGQQDYNSDGSKGEWSETVFDKNGKAIAWKSYDDKGNLDAWCDYKYDAKGVLIEEESHYNLEDVTYTYYKKGVKSSSVKYDENNNKLETEEYDENGNTLSSIEYDEDGNVTKQAAWEYDENENKVMYAYQKGDYIRITRCSYDKDGRILEEVESDGENIISARQYTHYPDAYECIEVDAKGELTAYEVYYEDNFGKGTFKYSPDGDLIESTKWVYDYDAEGYQIGTKYYRDEKLRSYYRFEVAEVDINENEAEDYVTSGDSGRSTRRRDDEFSMIANGSTDDA